MIIELMENNELHELKSRDSRNDVELICENIYRRELDLEIPSELRGWTALNIGSELRM